MSAHPSTRTPANLRFKARLSGLLSMIKDLIEGLQQDGLCKIGGEAVNVALGLVKASDCVILMEGLAEKQEYWVKILDRNSEFIIKDLVEVIKNTGVAIDGNIFKAPFSALQTLKNSPKWRKIDKEDWPILDSDIEEIWEDFTAMAKMVIHFVHDKRVPVVDSSGEMVYIKPKYLPNFDLEKQAKLFGVVLKGNP